MKNRNDLTLLALDTHTQESDEQDHEIDSTRTTALPIEWHDADTTTENESESEDVRQLGQSTLLTEMGCLLQRLSGLPSTEQSRRPLRFASADEARHALRRLQQLSRSWHGSMDMEI